MKTIYILLTIVTLIFATNINKTKSISDSINSNMLFIYSSNGDSDKSFSDKHFNIKF